MLTLLQVPRLERNKEKQNLHRQIFRQTKLRRLARGCVAPKLKPMRLNENLAPALSSIPAEVARSFSEVAHP